MSENSEILKGFIPIMSIQFANHHLRACKKDVYPVKPKRIVLALIFVYKIIPINSLYIYLTNRIISERAYNANDH